MKRFLCLFLVCLMLLPLVVSVVLLLPPVFDETFLGEMLPKLALLEEASPSLPRLILVGGSNVPFALRSDLLSQALPEYQVIDFGLYADLGIPFMLQLLEGKVSEGDLVIVQPEMTEQTFQGETGGESVLQALDGDPLRLFSLHGDVLSATLAALPVYLGDKLRYTLQGKPQIQGIYVQGSFNALGDIREGLREGNIMPLLHETDSALSLDVQLAEQALPDTLNRFAEHCRVHEAQLLFHFPPMNLASVPKVSQIDELYTALQAVLTFPMLGNPHDALMESAWFYDTDFHLNDAGAIMFTRLLVDDIRTFLEDTTANPIAAVQPPRAVSSSERLPGDEDAFLYRSEGDSYVICGVSDAGQTASELTLPGIHDGLPVYALDPGIFRAAEVIRLHVPAGYALPDGLLALSRVQELHLRSPNPSDYSVGDGLLEGSSAALCVPEDTLETYRRHYVFHRYAERLQAD